MYQLLYIVLTFCHPGEGFLSTCKNILVLFAALPAPVCVLVKFPKSAALPSVEKVTYSMNFIVTDGALDHLK